MIWTPNQIIGCRFENSPNNGNGDVFTEVGSVSYKNGVFGREVNLDNLNAFIQMGDNYVGSRLHGAEGFTVGGWITASTFESSAQEILSVMINDGGVIRVSLAINILNGDDLRIATRSQAIDGFQTFLVNGVFVVGTPLHIIAVGNYTNKTLKIYLDGKLEGDFSSISWGSNTYVHSANPAGNEDNIGRRAFGSAASRVYIDEFVMYTTDLPSTDIQRIYHGMHPLNG